MLFGAMDMFSVLIVVTVTQLCQIHRAVHLKSVHFLHVNYIPITLILNTSGQGLAAQRVYQ